MSRLVLVTGCDPATLLRAAAAPFLTAGRPGEPLPILALRQGGLRDAVHVLASEAGCVGWVGSPVVVFAELPALIAGRTAPLDQFERRAVLGRILVERAPGTLPAAARRTLLDALDRLFGDCIAEGLDDAAVARALASVDRDAWEAGRDDDLVALFAGYRAAIADLPSRDGVARTDGRDGLAIAARAVRAAPDAVRHRLRRPFDQAAAPRALHLYGLADLRRGWRALLAALRDGSVVGEIRVHVPDVASEGDDPDDSLRTWLARHADERVVVPAARGGATLHAVAAPDPTRELDAVAREVKRRIVGGGARPHDVAVVARKARPYLTQAAATFAAHGIPVHARLRHALVEIPAIAALLRLFETAAGGWRLAALESLAASPYFDAPLDRDVMRLVVQMGRPRSRTEWNAAFADLSRAAADAGADDDAPLPSPARIDAAAAAFAPLADALERHRVPRPLAAWLDATIAILTGADAALGYADRVLPELAADAPAALRDAVRLDGAALVHATDLLRTWLAALPLDREASRRMDAAAWLAALRETLADAEITLRTGHAGGVHLLEALSAEGRSFGHVFVVGLEAGAFPAEPPRDPLFADDERERLCAAGLPLEPTARWLAREEALYRDVVGAARESLHLSWCYADASGAKALPSAFAEDTLAPLGGDAMVHHIPGSAVVADAIDDVWSTDEAVRVAARGIRDGGATYETLALALASEHADATVQLLHAAAVEQARAAARAAADDDRFALAHGWNGDLTDAASRAYLAERFGDRTWSATGLERFARCPFTFLAARALEARAMGEVDPDDADARDVGSARHVALARIYPRLVDAYGDAALTTDDAEGVRAIVEAEVEAAIMEQGGAWTALAGLRTMRVQELTEQLVAYIQWEGTAPKGITRVPLYTEHPFDVRLDAGDGRTVRVAGHIDRVDRVLVDGQDTGYRYVVDHKSGTTTFDGITELRPAGAVLQLALYMRAMQAVEPDARLWGGAYQIVRRRERKGALDRCSVVKAGPKELGNPTQSKANDVVAGVPALVAGLVDGVLAGRFPARTPGKTDCLTYCDFRDVCREERIAPWTR